MRYLRATATLALLAGCSATDLRDGSRLPEVSVEGDSKVTAEPSSAGREAVVLLHGLARSGRSMAYLGRYLENQGFDAIIWSYPSLKWDVDESGRRLLADLAYLNASDRFSKLHLVGHSLGGIVARRALLYGVPSKMGRMVQLASPNRGAPRARHVGAFLGGLVAPLRELSDRDSSGVNQLGTPELVPIGVVAGERDWTVPVSYTRLDGGADHIVVPAGHTFIMRDREALRQVAAFLRDGRFEREAGNR